MARTQTQATASKQQYAEAWASRLGWQGGTDPYEREQAVARDPETRRNAEGNWQIGEVASTAMTDEEIFAELGIVVVAEEEDHEETAEEMAKRHADGLAKFLAQLDEQTQESEEQESETTNEQENKEEKEMTTTTNNTTGTRANRVVVQTELVGYTAKFFKTHKLIATVASTDTEWVRCKDHNNTQAREDFRTWIQNNSSQFGVAWIPELQEQAWDRHYWKYETDEQVEEDACTLMTWTINKLAQATKYDLQVADIHLDAIIPNESPLSYVENGRYTKNGNWAVAQVNLAVTLNWDGVEEEVIYPIEMRSGQLTKIKMNQAEFKAMVAEVFEQVKMA